MRFFTIIALVLFTTSLWFTGCDQKDEIKIGISIGPSNERWERDRDYLIKHLEPLGAKLFIKEANNNSTTQAEQVLELMKEKIEVLILVAVNSQTAGRIVQRVKQAGIKVIAYDRLIQNCDLDFYLSFDNVKVGELQADYLTRIKPIGNYAILGGSTDDYNSVLIRLGNMNILQPLITRGDVKIVLDKNVSGWEPENAYMILKEYLNDHDELDAVIAANDGIAEGAYRALEEHELTGKVILSGQDAQTDACRRIVEGKQTMTIYKYIQTLANAAGNVAMALAQNQDAPFSQTTVNNGEKMVPAILLPSMIQVTNENIRMTVIADGYLDEKQVFVQ